MTTDARMKGRQASRRRASAAKRLLEMEWEGMYTVYIYCGTKSRKRHCLIAVMFVKEDALVLGLGPEAATGAHCDRDMGHVHLCITL